MSSGERQVRIAVAGYTASVSVLDSANPSAPSLLALHGFTGSGEDFGQLRQALPAGEFSWIRPDFMGHGKSDAPDVVDPYQLPAVLRLIDQARSLAPDPDKVILLGYSMGGRLALQYLHHARPMPAILIGASPGLDNREERAARRASDRVWMELLDESMEGFCRKWEAQPLIEPQTRIEEPFRTSLAARRRGNSPSGLQNSLAACGTGVIPSLWNHLEKLPGLVLCHGSMDTRFRDIAHLMRKANPAFSVHEIPASGHAPHLENPAALAALLQGLPESLLYR